jgi:hypothetical protein
MARPIASPWLRAAVMVLVVSVMLCLVLPMTGGGAAGMYTALACCFVLAIALSVLLLRPPRQASLLGNALGLEALFVRVPTRTARSPDVFDLGSLLI